MKVIVAFAKGFVEGYNDYDLFCEFARDVSEISGEPNSYKHSRLRHAINQGIIAVKRERMLNDARDQR